MFYLAHFFRLIYEYPIRGLFYITTTLLVLVFFAQFSQIKTLLLRQLETEAVSGYFHALIPKSESHQTIARKLKSLPGVKTVQIISDNELNEKLKNVLEEVGIDDQIAGASSLDYVGLKIAFDPNLSNQSMKLIRDYLVRLVGENQAVLSRIYHNEQKPELSNKNLKYQLPLILAVLLVAIWGLCHAFMNSKIVQKGHLLEQFQRRSKVAFKLVTFGNILICSLGLVIVYFIPKSDYLGFLLIACLITVISLINLKKYQWK